MSELDDIYLIEEKEIKLQSERTVLYNSMEKLIEKNSNFKMNQTEYNKHYEKFKNQYDKINRELSEIESVKLKYKVRKQKVQDFINKLRENEKLITEFDETLWYALIERVIVSEDGIIEFEFKDGKSQTILTNWYNENINYTKIERR